ncbi:lipopolysaccharide transport periplasmic protein LptA [Asticcacaulis sp. AND118]|uniref:lipopolysaccharide transport periplasmic protein LptA n=1 Tax=Asticcacaulis sp. AND118 TaxID=2840468 RepID=UPI001CFF9E96|nr:lipopolysaccharide transport periplasmic protein LptA [Asticcacaulis sp. AND118]UDF03645.1 lipopolysaccharide transport periplasmic protein LptA [Asticcacaulis sp. AND118]
MQINKTVWVVGAAMVLAAPMASAQFVATKEDPIAYAADTFEADESNHTATFTGSVEFLQKTSRLRSDKMTVTYGQNQTTGKWDELSTAEAIGNVYYVVDDQVMTGSRAVYTKSTDTLVLTGNVVLKQGQNVMEGSRLVYNVGAKKSTMDGVPTTGSKSRVRGVFYPDQGKSQ